MIQINILSDGTVYPPLKKDDLIANVVDGKLMRLGRYNRSVFISRGIEFIEEPQNTDELKKAFIRLVNSSMPEILKRTNNMYFICPRSIFINSLALS